MKYMKEADQCVRDMAAHLPLVMVPEIRAATTVSIALKLLAVAEREQAKYRDLLEKALYASEPETQVYEILADGFDNDPVLSSCNNLKLKG